MVQDMLFRDILLAEIFALQAVWVLARTTRLPEAAGPRAGRCGSGRALRLLILGDSSAAGVGVARQEDALAGQITIALQSRFAVDWHLIAQSGATTRAATGLLERDGKDGGYDAAVLALGVNDVVRLTRRAAFADAQRTLIQRLQHKYGVGLILASAVPPMGAMQAFPQPLRAALGRRAAALDMTLAQICAQYGAQHVPFDMALSPDLLAVDGFHPGAALYRLWGARMAGLVGLGLS